MLMPPHIEDPEEDRHNLYDIWQSTEDPKPPWETFKKFAGITRGDIAKALDLWRKTKNR